MINRSLNSFMNAMTGTDYTMYPFSTGNEKDFQNLLSVYLDAVFRPNLRPIDFLQEAWRLGEGNDETDLIFKGKFLIKISKTPFLEGSKVLYKI